MEIMGLHLPGSSFVNPDTPLRDALTRRRSSARWRSPRLAIEFPPIGRIIDERAIVNGVVGLRATGGSTNPIIHLVAMAAAAGITLRMGGFRRPVAEVTPLLARIYPNGKADVNHFHAAGGMGLLIRELLNAGLLHGDARPYGGTSLIMRLKPISTPMARSPGATARTQVWRSQRLARSRRSVSAERRTARSRRPISAEP